MSQHLYEISKDFADLQRRFEDSENIDESMLMALNDTMGDLQLSFEEKAKNLVFVMKNVAANATAIDDEIKRLQAKKVVIKNKEDGFRRYLRENMKKTGISKIDCELFSITLCKAVQKLEVVSEKDLPDDLIDIETKIVPKKDEIKRLLKAGEEVSGAQLIDSTQRLIIK